MWTELVEHRVEWVGRRAGPDQASVHNHGLTRLDDGTLRRMTPHLDPSTSHTGRDDPHSTASSGRNRLHVVPGTRVIWRSADSVQWESGGRAYVLEGIDPASLAALLREPADESPDAPGNPAVRGLGAGSAVVSTRRALHALGLLWRPPGVLTTRRTGLEPDDLPERLLGDLGALAARRGDDAGAVMAARRSRSVRLIGTDRLAASIGCVLAAAGIGRLELPLDGESRLWQAMPGGLTVADEGRRRADATAAAIRAAAPEVDIGSSGDGRAPDLMIITGSRPADDDLRTRLQDDGIPHLLVGVDSARATIGPLVVPGDTSCLRCADLHRMDRDPAWPALAAQLATAPVRFEPSDVALCSAATGIAALQALAFLDGETPASVEGTLEMTLPDWRLRRRSRPQHPACGCRRESA